MKLPIVERLEEAGRLAAREGWVGEDEIYFTAAATITELVSALGEARDALGDYACHAGPDVPCLRTADQCAANCGKIAGNAFVRIDTALSNTRGDKNDKG